LKFVCALTVLHSVEGQVNRLLMNITCLSLKIWRWNLRIYVRNRSKDFVRTLKVINAVEGNKFSGLIDTTVLIAWAITWRIIQLLLFKIQLKITNTENNRDKELLLVFLLKKMYYRLFSKVSLFVFICFLSKYWHKCENLDL